MYNILQMLHIHVQKSIKCIFTHDTYAICETRCIAYNTSLFLSLFVDVVIVGFVAGCPS